MTTSKLHAPCHLGGLPCRTRFFFKVEQFQEANWSFLIVVDDVSSSWYCFYAGWSWNRGTPKSFVLISCFLLNHPFLGYHLWKAPADSLQNHHPLIHWYWRCLRPWRKPGSQLAGGCIIPMRRSWNHWPWLRSETGDLLLWRTHTHTHTNHTNVTRMDII